ncbi:MAG: TonB-dependent receptor [candidate division WOR-3 bacterium]|nr:MAG: TonB-dependent receptor [candidate division WOR-3 bacterium]
MTFLLLAAAFGQDGAVNGFVRDASNGEPLAFANVYLDPIGQGAATNDRGYYYIGGVPEGSYQLAASYVGYKTERRYISVEQGLTTTADITLDLGAVEVDEVVVSAERARFEREVEISATRLETRQLALIPRVGGEVDLFRAIQLLPGVISTSDFSNKLYIRGGSPDQNLILLDGITVYNPSHLFGIFSPFVPEAISDVTLLAGGHPANYGGRLSSVLDVVTKEGNSKKYTGEGSLSLLAAKAIAEGPIPKGSFLVAGRRTYLPDALLSAFDVEGLGYYFYDLMGKVNYAPSPDYAFTLTGLGAEDVLDFWDPDDRDNLNARLNWGNRGVSLRSNMILTPTLYGEVIGAWSNFFSQFRVSFGPADQAVLKTDLTDFMLKSDFTWYLADRHTLSLGTDLKAAQMAINITYDTTEFERRDTIWPLSAYVEDKWELVPERLFFRPGLRYSWYSKGSRHELEPRLGVKYKPWENTAFNVAFGRFTQPVLTLNSTEAVFSIYDVWVAVPRDRETPSAVHYIAGVEQWLQDDVILELEAYYKDYDNLLETRYGEMFTPPDSLLGADGYSYGAELMLRKTEGWYNGWVSYSYMWTKRSTRGESYSPHYDRRHNLNVVSNFPRLFLGVDVTARFTLGTGLPYAGIIGYYRRRFYRPDAGNQTWFWTRYIEGPRDAFRYPLYHRLDAGLSKTWKFKWGEVTGFLDVINVYYARNVLLYYWDTEDDEELPTRKKIGMLPILPTVGVKVGF